MSYQMFAPLDLAVREALRSSIERFGVLIPIVVSTDGEVLDGHHRKEIAEELGIDMPEPIRIEVVDEYHAQQLAVTLNADRRQLTAEIRRQVVEDLRAKGHSYRAIAGATRVSKTQVERDLAQVSPPGTPERILGRDGRSYPAKREPSQQVHELPLDDQIAHWEQVAKTAAQSAVRSAALDHARSLKARRAAERASELTPAQQRGLERIANEPEAVDNGWRKLLSNVLVKLSQSVLDLRDTAEIGRCATEDQMVGLRIDVQHLVERLADIEAAHRRPLASVTPITETPRGA